MKKSQIYSLLSISILFFSLKTCTDRIYRYYEFEGNKVLTEYGESRSGVSGDFVNISSVPNIINFGNPYRFTIAFHTDDENNSPIKVGNIKIKSQSGEVLYAFDGREMETIWSRESEDYFSTWVEPEIQLEHQPITIEYDLIFKVGNRETKKSIIENLQTKYKERKSNSFVDVFLGV